MRTNYPFPVLGNTDDIEGEVHISIDCVLGSKSIDLSIQTKIINPKIEALVDRREALIVVEVACTSTFFRETLTIENLSASVSLPAEALRNRVTIDSFIVAARALPNYKPDHPHPDFAGLSYAVDEGDVLAVGPSGSFLADKKFDPMTSGASSFMKVGRGGDDQMGCLVELGTQFIILFLSPREYDKYVLARDYSTAALHAAIALPALVQVLDEMVESNDFEDCVWYQRLTQIISDKEIDVDNSLQAAQELLDWPIGRMLADFETRISPAQREDDDE